MNQRPVTGHIGAGGWPKALCPLAAESTVFSSWSARYSNKTAHWSIVDSG